MNTKSRPRSWNRLGVADGLPASHNNDLKPWNQAPPSGWCERGVLLGWIRASSAGRNDRVAVVGVCGDWDFILQKTDFYTLNIFSDAQAPFERPAAPVEQEACTLAISRLAWWCNMLGSPIGHTGSLSNFAFYSTWPRFWHGLKTISNKAVCVSWFTARVRDYHQKHRLRLKTRGSTSMSTSKELFPSLKRTEVVLQNAPAPPRDVNYEYCRGLTDRSAGLGANGSYFEFKLIPAMLFLAIIHWYLLAGWMIAWLVGRFDKSVVSRGRYLVYLWGSASLIGIAQKRWRAGCPREDSPIIIVWTALVSNSLSELL